MYFLGPLGLIDPAVHAKIVAEKDAEIERLNALVELWREYEAFLYEASRAANDLAYAHGYFCPLEIVKRGREYRKRLGIEFRDDLTQRTPERTSA